MKKASEKRREVSNQLTSIKRVKYFQKEICVVLCHDFVCSVRGEEDRLILNSVCLLLSLLLPFLLLTIFARLFSSDGFSCLSASPLSCSLTFSLSLLTFYVSMSVSLRGDSAQRHKGLTGG